MWGQISASGCWELEFGSPRVLFVAAGKWPLILRVLYTLLAASLSGIILILNLRAYSPGDLETTVAQLAFLKEAMVQGAADRMQDVYPEGYVFTWALYGAASARASSGLGSDDPRRSSLFQEALEAVAHVESETARSTFDDDLEPEFGAFYASWSLYLRAEVIRGAGMHYMSTSMLKKFERDCQVFASALQKSGTPFLPSYTLAAWPGDTAVGIAALGIHDKILSPRFAATIESWVRDVRLRLDNDLHAITHEADADSGMPAGGVRGSTLALVSRVLVEADPEFARQQYTVLRSSFVDYTWGVPGVREYPRGVDGTGDVDSGPIFLGFSAPAVIVGAAAAVVHGDKDLANTLFGAVEVGGAPLQLEGRRRYLVGVMPVADAFIAWARSPTPQSGSNSGRREAAIWEPILPRWWAGPAHVISVVAVGLLLFPVLRFKAARATY